MDLRPIDAIGPDAIGVEKELPGPRRGAVKACEAPEWGS